MRRILLVDDDRDDIDLLSKILTADGKTIQTAFEPDAALHRLKAWKPHLVVLNMDMPAMKGANLLSKIRILTQDEYTSVILTSASKDLDEIKKGFEEGADRFLSKPLRAHDVASSIRSMLKLKEAQDSLRRANHRIEELFRPTN